MSSASQAPLFEGIELTKSFGGSTVLSDVSIRVDRGEVLGLIGPNGAGKSTLLKVSAGLLKPTAGKTLLDGRDVTRLPMQRRRVLGMSMTFQTPLSSELLTVEEQILAQIRGLSRVNAPGGKRLLERFDRAVGAMNLEDVLKKRTGQLTLGELRRFEFGRALVDGPSLLFIDEPASGMTADEAALLSETVRAVRDTGVGVILVEHNIPFVRSTADRVIALDAGRVISTGATEEVLQSDEVREAYLGLSTP